jgi:hypothetical protein
MNTGVSEQVSACVNEHLVWNCKSTSLSPPFVPGKKARKRASSLDPGRLHCGACDRKCCLLAPGEPYALRVKPGGVSVPCLCTPAAFLSPTDPVIALEYRPGRLGHRVTQIHWPCTWQPTSTSLGSLPLSQPSPFCRGLLHAPDPEGPLGCACACPAPTLCLWVPPHVPTPHDSAVPLKPM